MNDARALVWLVTSEAHDGEFRDGEPGHEALDAELASRGVEGRWVCWDDPDVDWAAADLVAVRSTWDYVERYATFLDWAASLDQGRLLNSAEVFRWNHDKAYLAELAASGAVPTVPTSVARTAEEAREAVGRYGASVVKPAVGAGGDGLFLTGDAGDPALGTPSEGGWVVQPLVESVRTAGESSVFVIDGRAAGQVDKWPGGDEVRVHEHRGGVSRPVPLDEERAATALAAYGWVAQRFGHAPDYLRVDLLAWQGRWAVSELELIEPGLYLDVQPSNAVPFVDLVVDRLAGRTTNTLD